MTAYNPHYIDAGLLSDMEKRVLAAKAPEGYAVEFVEWCNQSLIQWQMVQDLLNPNGGDFEVVPSDVREPPQAMRWDFAFRLKDRG